MAALFVVNFLGLNSKFNVLGEPFFWSVTNHFQFRQSNCSRTGGTSCQIFAGDGFLLWLGRLMGH